MKRLALILVAACGVEQQEPPDVQPEGPVTAEAPPPPTREASAALTGFPCDVRAVLQSNCASCHTGETYAPLLSRREDFLPTYGAMAATLINAETAPMMPPAYATKRPTDAERALLTAWFNEGMPAGSCGPLTNP